MKLKLLLIIIFIINSLCKAQNSNTFLGQNAGSTGINNTFIGRDSGKTNTGNYNVFTGYRTGVNNGGSQNLFIGHDAGQYNLSGQRNVFLGAKSGTTNSVGSYNVFAGYESGYNNKGNQNIFIGHESGFNNNSGNNNIFTGREAGYNNTIGNYNIFTGDESGQANLDGYGNTFMGRQSGYHNSAGSYNLYLGYKAGYTNISGSNNIFLGYNAGESELGSNRLYIDNTGTSTPLIYGKFDTDQVGINTNVIPAGYAMAVKGKFITEEIKVQTYANWPDFVFKKEYPLPSINEVEKHIKEKGHLPNIPSASEVSENGILLGEMNAKLLQKIEELTLYIIQQEKRFNDQEARLKKLEAEISLK
ncbi:hypothetical protein [Flavobacterium gyeonganense]|uniref:Endosialidase-like protein n=1 Tax=Flavobacterium gyeonganense TaxID=1310418 RepID=A0ABV5H8L1_9FLAO|nr:hypothetical protein [Flavobacterium gyeonganense]